MYQYSLTIKIVHICIQIIRSKQLFNYNLNKFCQYNIYLCSQKNLSKTRCCIVVIEWSNERTNLRT